MTLELADVVYVNDTGTTVLNGVGLRLEEGHTVGLTGRNGSGKTTLLNVMMGFLPARSGTVSVDGSVLRTERQFQRCRGGTMGMVFQNVDDQLFCPSVEEEVAFGPLNLGRSRADVRNIVDEVLRRVGMDGFQTRVPHKLSVGEKRLVALAAVLSMCPRFLLLDEPTAGLDSAAKSRLLEVLKSAPSGMLVVTHDAEVLNMVCDSRIELCEGKIR